MRELLQVIVLGCLAYLIMIYAIDALLVLIAAVDNAIRSREARAEHYDSLSVSRFTIPVSVIVPVHDEESIVLHCLRALLEQRYPEFELIVVNDGSTDRTLELLREAFALKPVEVFNRRIVPSEPLRGVYRSDPYPSLTVVDKEAGGNKAGALNCGLNFARYRYVCCVDGDTIYSPDALLKGMRLAIRDPATVVGVTSQIVVASRPEADGAQAIDRGLLNNFQHIEYVRAFLNDRLAWSRLGFMLCTSGAFMLYRRDVLEEVGGFSPDFSCEDIEVTFRVHEKLKRDKRRYRIVALPDPVARTEVPDGLRSLIAQRARWHRVVLETVWHYRRMLANPRYGTVGLLGLPFYLLSEVLAPIFEVLGLVSLIASVWLGLFDWFTYVLLFGVMSFANAILTSAAILLDDLNSRSYRLRHLVRLILFGPLELLVYRPALIWARMEGSWGFLRRKRAWDKFERNPRPAVTS